MPGQRGKGQTLVAFPLDEELLRALDSARGAKSRSALVRQALFEHLKALGYNLDETIILPPDRAGKGGRPKKVVEIALPKVAEGGEPAPKFPTKKVSYKAAKKKTTGE